MHSKTLFCFTIAAALAAPALMSSPAAADVPPPDVCDTEGKTCNNAGASYDEKGTCQSSMCSRVSPSEDGGTETVEYECMRCMTGGAGSSGSDDGGGSGCSITRTVARDTGLVLAMAVAGLAALGLSRRRSR